MIFNSLEYAIFLPIVFALYWLLPHKFRWILLLAASYYFYMCWNVKYVVIFLFTTVITYFAAILLEKAKIGNLKKAILAGTLVCCLGVLFFFKYFNFVSESFAGICRLFALEIHPVTLSFLLPMGISFYTFQTLSYVIDVYRGNFKAERHFGYYAVFISFFPQLVAGPIERTENLLPQIKREQKFSYDQASYGLKMMAWGLFKKICIADVLGVYVDQVFGALPEYHGFSVLLAVIFFTFQIYCDFSGYSDIAIGSAKLMGIELMQNFKSPYFAKSIKEFWARWHISLSSWLRDYVYIPLGGNRRGKFRRSLNLLITFLASGLWHGANWTFVLWGAIHGISQVVENMLEKILKPVRSSKAGKLLSVCFVFVFCSFAWIFFRAGSIQDAIYVIQNLFRGISEPKQYIKAGLDAFSMGYFSIAKIALSLLLLSVFDYLSLRCDVIAGVSKLPIAVRWAGYFALLVMICLFAQIGENTFIYFQF